MQLLNVVLYEVVLAMNYKPYPKSKDTASRKARKNQRGQVFIHNRYELKRQRKAVKKNLQAEV